MAFLAWSEPFQKINRLLSFTIITVNLLFVAFDVAVAVTLYLIFLYHKA